MAGRKKKKKKARSIKRKLFIYFIVSITGSVAMAALLVLAIYLGAYGKLPDQEEIRSIKQSNASLVYSSDSTLMGKYYEVNRQSIGNDDMSLYVRQALIATEDNRFFEHHGVDYISVGRVFFKSLLMGDRGQGGGSTISQQLAKNLYKRRDYGFLSLPVNKIREMFIASDLENIYSKEEILTMYLNSVSFGENVYGIEAAAWRFYGKSSSELDISESATMVGMLAANTLYNPRLYPDNAVERRNTVFSRMHTQGFISREQAMALSMEPIKLNYSPLDRNRGIAPYFRQYIRQEILTLLDDSIQLETDGLRIYTTIQKDIQAYAEGAIDLHMRKLQAEFDDHWNGRTPWEDDPEIFDRALSKTNGYQKLLENGIMPPDIKKELSISHKRNILTALGEEVMDISTIDSLKHYMSLLNTGFLAIDPRNGGILAWVGGKNFQYLPYDHVLSKRQCGSTFKPLVYTSALLGGMKPCQYISNERRIYEEYNEWSPGNSNGEYEGYYSLAGGLMNSVNTISAEVMVRTGTDAVVDLAYALGIDSELPEVPSLALGTADVSLMEMVSAYTAFANYGTPAIPFGISRIEDSQGNIIYENKEIQDTMAVFDKDIGILMNHILIGVIDQGTGSSARSVYGLSSDLAGKTGTTQNNADGWFIGYTPGIVAGVWVGAELPAVHFRTTALGSGAHMALPIFARTIKEVESNNDLSQTYMLDFAPVPDTLVVLLDCPPYSRDLPLEHLNRREKREFKREVREREDSVLVVKKEKKGFFRKVGDLFRRKKK